MSNHPGIHKGACIVQNVWTEAAMDTGIHKLQSVLGS